MKFICVQTIIHGHTTVATGLFHLIHTKYYEYEYKYLDCFIRINLNTDTGNMQGESSKFCSNHSFTINHGDTSL